MIYFLHGNDFEKRKKLENDLIKKLGFKRAGFFRLEKLDFDLSKFEELVKSSGLFSQELIILVQGVFELPDAKNFILKNIKEISSSKNTFIFTEDEADKGVLGALEGYAEISEFESNKVKPREFNIFSISDAFGGRDSRGAWLLFQKAELFGVSAEEVFNIIFWQIKMMMLAKDGKEPKKINPFVFKKAKSYSALFSKDELENISSRFMSLYHEARRGTDLSLEMEKIFLSL